MSVRELLEQKLTRFVELENLLMDPAVLADSQRLATMGAAASALIPRDADEKLARLILGAAR